MTKIIVKSMSDRGFRRAGIQFTRDGVELDTSTLKPEQLKAITNEPALVVVGDVESPAERKAREKAEAEAAAKAAAEKAEAEAAERAAAEKAEAEAAAKAAAAEADKAKASAGKSKGAK